MEQGSGLFENEKEEERIGVRRLRRIEVSKGDRTLKLLKELQRERLQELRKEERMVKEELGEIEEIDTSSWDEEMKKESFSLCDTDLDLCDDLCDQEELRDLFDLFGE